MSEVLKGVPNYQEERFKGFVETHAERAIRWEVMDRRLKVPFKFVEFDITDKDDNLQSAGSPLIANYSLDLWLKMPPNEQKKHGLTAAGVLLEFDVEEGAFTLTDDCSRLSALRSSVQRSAGSGGQLIGMLLDRLQELEDREVMIPAGQRTYPLDGNIINQLNS